METDKKEEKSTRASLVPAYVRCKVCGFVMRESALGDCCPACGVKRVAFVPDTERISEKRRKILDAHIHPIIVHIPQAFAFSALVLSLSLLMIPEIIENHVRHSLQVLAVFLPLSGIIGFLSGLYDGNVRFKKITTPLLKQKIIGGSTFIVFAACLTWQALTLPAALSGPGAALLIGVAFLAFVCTIFLGKIGALLAGSKMPG